MKRINNVDLILVILLAIILTIGITIPPLNEHIDLLIPYVLLLFFLAGYSILTALSTKNRALGSKIIISILISTVVLFLFILSHHYITFITRLLILAAITLFFAAVGYIRRHITSRKAGKYLVCENCNSYYKLKKGESLEDFEACHCGGNLRYVEINFMSKDEPKRKKRSIEKKTSKKSKTDAGKYLICENCGGHYQLKKGESLEDFEACHCGGKLKYAEKYYKLNEKSRSKIFPNSIVLVIILSLLAVIAVIFPQVSTIIKIILVLPLLFFLPGYSIIKIFFQQLSQLKLTISSFVLSTAVTFLFFLIFSSLMKVFPTKCIIVLAFLTIILIIISPFINPKKTTKKSPKLDKKTKKPSNLSKSLLIRSTQPQLHDKNLISTLNSKNSRFIPLDIVLILLLTFLCVIFVLTPVLNNTVFRIIFSLILFLFASGYSLIAALFPNKYDINGKERTALSFGLSIAVTPLIGLLLNYTPFGIRLEPILISLSLFTILMTIIAYIRRLMLYEDERFRIDFKCYFNRTVESFRRESGTDRILSIILVISIILAVSATTYAMIPKEGEKFTEFYILGQNGKASDYPNNLTVGQTGNVTVGIVNHEYSTVNYKMVIKLNNQTINEKNITLSNNQAYSEPFTFIPSTSGQNQELEFLLYKLPDENNIYRSLHLWINVGY